MGVKDLKNLRRNSAYLRPDQWEFLDRAAGETVSSCSVCRQDILRYAVDLLMQRHPDLGKDIKKAIRIIRKDR